MSQKIVIQVDPQGNSQVRTEGFSGASCQAASRFIEQALGRTVSDQLTPDYFNTLSSQTEAKTNVGEPQ